MVLQRKNIFFGDNLVLPKRHLAPTITLHQIHPYAPPISILPIYTPTPSIPSPQRTYLLDVILVDLDGLPSVLKPDPYPARG